MTDKGRDVVRLPAWVPERQVQDEARRIYLERLRRIDEDPATAPPLFVATLVRYHNEVTLGPSNAKRPATAAIEMSALRNIACWLIDRDAGREEAPGKPADLLPPSRPLAKLVEAHDLQLTQFGPQELARLVAYLSRRMSAAGVNMTLRVLRAALNWAVHMELIHKHPVGKLSLLPRTARTDGARYEAADRRKRHYTQEELARLDAALDGEARRWVRLSYLTGARLGELERLRPEHIDRKEGVVHIPAGKTSAHIVLLTPSMAQELEGWTGWTVQAVTHGRRVLHACRDLDIVVAQSLHGLRHSLVTALRQAGLPLEDIARWLGQSLGRSPVTGVYDHAHMAALRRVAEAIPVPWET
jgi:integrase